MTRTELLKGGREAKLSPQELSRIFLNHVYGLPDGKRINLCIQCGTCSGSCPTALEMEYSPREIFAALRAGMLDRVLHSNTVWMCTSCYYCTVRCPQKIGITDIMYELKRLGMMHGYPSSGAKAAKMANLFINLTNRTGRSNESMLMMQYYLTTNPFSALNVAFRGMQMFLKGRLPLPFGGSVVKGLGQMKAIREKLAELEAKKLAKEEKA
jgi:heterodisulfide reductase subunit C